MDFEKLVKEMLSNQDTAPETAQKLIDGIKTQSEALEGLKTENETLKTRVEELQRVNVSLFMGQTKEVEENTEDNSIDDLEGEEYVDAFLNQKVKDLGLDKEEKGE